MIGETIESRPATPIWAFIYLFLAIGLAALLAATQDKWQTLFFAVIPLGMAAGAWWNRERPTIFRVESDRLTSIILYGPPGSGRCVLPQPPRRSRPAGSRVTTVVTPPRRKASA